jgi:uncharacterized protein (TIGR02678 family)
VSALAEQIAAERRAAMRALLAKPLLVASGADGESVAFVRAHAEWLREWLSRNCGWTLQVEPEMARLRKLPGDLRDGTRGARDRTSDLPFSRRRYTLLCLALAALERADRQTTLGNLARDVLAAVASEPAFFAAGMTFDLDAREARRDLVHVVRLLIDLCVLRRVHGLEEHFVDHRGDVLYNVDRPSLSALLAVRRGPSTVKAEAFEQRLAAVVEEPTPESDEARNRRLRVTLTRRLLDDPVVYYDDLDDDERAYLATQRAHLVRQIHEATGLIAEVRREGIALVDPEGALTDERMPDEGTEGHVTLLVAEYLARAARAEVATGARPLVPLAAIVAHIGGLKREHRMHWRKDALAPGAEMSLALVAVERLTALRLVRRVGDGLEPRPALGRYRLLAPTTRARVRVPRQSELFE